MATDPDPPAGAPVPELPDVDSLAEIDKRMASFDHTVRILKAERILEEARSFLPPDDPRRGLSVPIDPDLVIVLEAFVDYLVPHRLLMATAHERIDIAKPFQEFWRALSRAGYLTANRDKIRAQRYRMMGELCDRRGNLEAALLFYVAALQNDPKVGCKRRMESLRKLPTLEQLRAEIG